MSLAFAYAEEQTYYEPRFKFPIPSGDNIDEIMEKCGLKSISDLAMHIQCDFMLSFGDDGMNWWLEIVERIGITAEDKERKDLGIEDQPPKDPRQTHYERDLIKLEEKDANPDKELSPAEEEYLALLNQYAQCYRGYDQARGIQEDSSYIVGTIQMDNPEWSPEAINRDGSHQKLALAVQECLAQKLYLLPLLGDYRAEGDVQSRQSWFGEKQPHHSEQAADVPQWSQDRVNTESNPDRVTSDRHPICELGSYYGDATKRMFCPEEYDYVFIHDGTVTYESEAMRKYKQYKFDNGEEMLQDLKTDVIKKKLTEQREWVKASQ